MSQFFLIHPDNPQARLMRQAVNILQKGGLVVFPTDSGYAMGCKIDALSAIKRIKLIRQLEDKHDFSLFFNDISTLQEYAVVDNTTFRILKSYMHDGYTFILQATKLVPKKMLKANSTTIGVRMPANKIVTMLIEELAEPLLTTSLLLPNYDVPISEPLAIQELLGKQVDLIVDGGNCPYNPTTIVDLTDNNPVVLRVGLGDPTPFSK